ncbi:MAG: sigma-54 dependent transcriptional regulator [Nitrospinae bacterium]|jgi:DNA-binding NtrC family response regulator|nr:sigma-54 dependent transcriptional regulator [Nitrospinota bacterium]MDA1110851.1 sigma-54 dependent transcriptional regulator [Nitrospinota bacterium]
MQQKILILDSSRPSIETLRQALKHKNYEVIAAYTSLEGEKRLLEKVFHLVLINENIVAKNGQKFLDFLHRRFPGLPGILLTRQGLPLATEETAEKSGFHLYLRSQGTPKLLELIGEIFSQGNEASDSSAPETSPGKLFQLLGESPSIRHLRETLRTVAATDAGVLLRGETGTGKELAARFLHAHSPRSQNQFVAVNCAALTESLLESELFGHEKGAFTGAHRQKLGKFEYAGSGTLFLDEIGEISPHLQAKMLRVLDDRQFERVGGNKTLDVHCRVIAASNIDFSEALKAGRFREDLYYRLNVVSIDLPPLRNRLQDIPLLARHFLTQKSQHHNKPAPEVSPEALKQLQSYAWPGNVRELENSIEQAVILSRTSTLSDFPLPGHQNPTPTLDAFDDPSQMTLKEYLSSILKESEARYFEALLKRHQGHISRAAQSAGIDRKTFYRKIAHCGVDPKAYKPKR